MSIKIPKGNLQCDSCGGTHKLRQPKKRYVVEWTAARLQGARDVASGGHGGALIWDLQLRLFAPAQGVVPRRTPKNRDSIVDAGHASALPSSNVVCLMIC